MQPQAQVKTLSSGASWKHSEQFILLRRILDFEVAGYSFVSYFLSLEMQEHMEDLEVGHAKAFKQI